MLTIKKMTAAHFTEIHNLLKEYMEANNVYGEVEGHSKGETFAVKRPVDPTKVKPKTVGDQRQEVLTLAAQLQNIDPSVITKERYYSKTFMATVPAAPTKKSYKCRSCSRTLVTGCFVLCSYGTNQKDSPFNCVKCTRKALYGTEEIAPVHLNRKELTVRLETVTRNTPYGPDEILSRVAEARTREQFSTITTDKVDSYGRPTLDRGEYRLYYYQCNNFYFQLSMPSSTPSYLESGEVKKIYCSLCKKENTCKPYATFNNRAGHINEFQACLDCAGPRLVELFNQYVSKMLDEYHEHIDPYHVKLNCETCPNAAICITAQLS